MRKRGRAFAAAILALAAVGAEAQTQTETQTQTLEEYRAFREARFADVQRANPAMQARAAEIKAQTAALVSAAPRRLAGVDAPPVLWRAATILPVLYDTPVAPRMVIVPAGEFTLSGAAPRRVRIGYPLAVSMFPVTFAEFSLFADQTGYRAAGACVMPGESGGGPQSGARSWRQPGFAQTFRSPAVCIALADAQAYARWLSGKTGHRYRLLSDAEYEYALRAGTASAFWWGEDAQGACRESAATPGQKPAAPVVCQPELRTAELGQSRPNGFGLYDMAGNVASWTADCWTGAAAKRKDCRHRVVRGASWATQDYRSDARRKEPAEAVRADLGFRIAREL